MAKIRFENVKKGFNDVVVVKDLSLTINAGEFFTFVGPSGCGKSTLLNMIAGLEPVAEGKIYFDDVLVNDLSPKERDVAMVFQSYALYPHMTVYENMAFPLQMKKAEKDIIDNEVKKASSGIENNHCLCYTRSGRGNEPLRKGCSASSGRDTAVRNSP